RARDLAAVKSRLQAVWPAVAVRDLELSNGSYVTGGRIEVRARVELGELRPDDVEVQVAYGRLDEGGGLRAPSFPALAPGDGDHAGGTLFAASLTLNGAGQFGYTARVVPRLDGRPAPSELGLASWAPDS